MQAEQDCQSHCDYWNHIRRHIMEECRKELCARCAIRDWCNHRLDQAANRSEIIRRMVNAANPNFIVR
ncbi:MAG: hypothetical protein PUF41_11705 [Prevotella copri]|nr:hypothetical protein [Segatella copri]